MSWIRVMSICGIVVSVTAGILDSRCPCSNPDWCKQIRTIPKKEIFAFVLTCTKDTWVKFDWEKVTTIGLAGNFYDPDLMCYAHRHGVRIVTLVDFPKSQLLNATARHQWVKSNLAYAQEKFLDGVNIDFEESIPKDSQSEREALTALAQEAADAFHKAIPGSQVTFDVPSSPDCTYGRCFDYYSLGKVMDFLFIMDYDEWSISSIAGANSGFYQTLHGIKRYLQIGIPAVKLLMGVPWYGYDYTCKDIDVANRCHTLSCQPLHPGLQSKEQLCNNGLLAVTSHTYSGIMDILNSSSTGRLWDQVTLSPYFNYKVKQSTVQHQMWYDDPESLTLKYVVSIALELRGVGMWHANCLDYSNTTTAKHQREAMWGALPNFDLL